MCSHDAELDAYQRDIDSRARAEDELRARAHQISRQYKSRGLLIAWELCYQQAEEEAGMNDYAPE